MRRLLKATLLTTIVTASLAAVSTEASAVGTRRIALRSASDLKAGELKGVAVDSAGVVRAGLNLGKVPLNEALTVWSALSLDKQVLLATGNEGRLLQYVGGANKELAKADAMALTSIVRGWDGKIFVGSLPGAKIFELKDGQLVEWLALGEAEHIFQLAFDAKAGVLYAATGPEGKLFRITKDKKAQVYFDADEQHLMSVAIGSGNVFAGGGDKAKLYEIRGPGRASVLHDFARTEVRAIAVSGKLVYAIANEIKGKRNLPSSKPSEKKTSSSSGATKGKGTLYRFDQSGAPEQLLDDESEYFTSLALDEKGKPYVGTGVEGRLYTIDDNHNSVLVADTDARQLTALSMAGPQRFVVSSDPGVVYPIRGVGGSDAIWTSKVIDAGLRARYGRLEWSAEGRLEMSTRTGNTKEPDDTWSEWSEEMTKPARVTSPAARFIQVRARFDKDPNAQLREVVVPFVTDNLRAVLTQIDVDNASVKAASPADGKLRASGGPITDDPENSIEISWDVDNPDKDELRYRLLYRREGTGSWFEMLEPHRKLTKTKYSWDTRDLPEGRYRVRVVATDELSNPPNLVRKHQLDSHILTVDNTAPVLTDLKVVGRTVTGRAVDGVSPIARIEASLAGTDDWVPFAPNDGIFDSPSERFSADLSSLTQSGPALVTLRVYDQENNQTVRSVTLR